MNNLKKSDSWKNQLAIAVNFISSKDSYEERVVHLNSDTQKPSFMTKSILSVLSILSIKTF